MAETKDRRQVDREAEEKRQAEVIAAIEKHNAAAYAEAQKALEAKRAAE